MLACLILCFFQQPESFVVVPLNSNKYDSSRIRNELVAGRIDLRDKEMSDLAIYCENMARVASKEILEQLTKSKDFSHCCAAGFYYGFKLDPSEELFKLMKDKHPLVQLAAKNSLLIIAKDKYNEDVDFGPLVFDLNDEEKINTSITLWQTYVKEREANIKKESVKPSQKDK